MNTERLPEPLDESFAAIRQIEIPERPSDADLLAQLRAGPRAAVGERARLRKKTLMRVTICSTAIALLLALGSLLLLPGSGSVALAQVIVAAEKHKVVRYKQTEVHLSPGGEGGETLAYAAYADLKAPRFRVEYREPDAHAGAIDFQCVFITDGSKNVKLRIITEEITDQGRTAPALIERLKMFESSGVPRKEVTLSNAHGDFTPATATVERPFLENIRELEKHKDVVSTKGTLNGKAVFIYRIEEQHRTSTLTVDAQSKLPLRLEHEITDPVRIKFVLSDFEWDPDLGDKTADQLFATTPPEGYTVKDLRTP